MKRSFKRKKEELSPIDAFMDELLKHDGFTPFYCGVHGKQLVKEKFARNGRPNCTEKGCGKPLFTPEEWAFKQDVRTARKRRVQLLRHHLEE